MCELVVSNGELDMPEGVGFQQKGSTGMRFSGRRSHSPTIVMDYLAARSKCYDPYIPILWDCEDFAFLATAEVRCKFLGLPIAIGLRSQKNGHAVVILWFENQVGSQKKWEPIFFDPTLGKQVYDFIPDVIIPFPVGGEMDREDLPGFENLSYLDSAAFVLDGRNYKYSLIDLEVIPTLKKKGIDECPKPTNKEELALFRNDKYWNYGDRTFFWFAHIRQKHKGAPVGIAFGKAEHKSRKEPFDYAALVLWRSADSFIYWDISGANEPANLGYANFKPRLVIV
jgi:hypothetical protein